MASGGARLGAGRKRSGPDSIPVNWRVSDRAKVWILKQARVQGVSVAAIIDELIKAFEEQAELQAYEDAFLDECGMA